MKIGALSFSFSFTWATVDRKGDCFLSSWGSMMGVNGEVPVYFSFSFQVRGKRADLPALIPEGAGTFPASGKARSLLGWNIPYPSPPSFDMIGKGACFF